MKLTTATVAQHYSDLKFQEHLRTEILEFPRMGASKQRRERILILGAAGGFIIHCHVMM